MAQAVIIAVMARRFPEKGHGLDFPVLPEDALLAVDDQASNT